MSKKYLTVKGILITSVMVCILSAFMFRVTCCRAESVTEAGKEAAVLTFSSFGGGGPEYRIVIEDPQIVSYECRTVYDDPDQMMPGAGYNDIFTFTGLKPGTTKVTVSMTSPLTDGHDIVYTAVVDDDLNVTLTREKAISLFELYRNGEIAYDSYKIITFMDKYSLSVNGEDFRTIDGDGVDALYQAVEEYDLYRWDGFNESRDNVLDGEGFRLEILFTDGTSIRANGDNAFPEDYFPAIGRMQEILESMEATGQ